MINPTVGTSGTESATLVIEMFTLASLKKHNSIEGFLLVVAGVIFRVREKPSYSHCIEVGMREIRSV